MDHITDDVVLKLNKSLKITVTIVLFLLGYVDGTSGVSQQLEAKVSVNINRIAVGDRISISGSIKNSSTERITVFKRPRAYVIFNLNIFDAGGNPLKGFRLATFDLAPVTRADFVELIPGDSISMIFSGVLKKDKIIDNEKPGKQIVEGLFLTFDDDNSAFLIPGQGQYRLRLEYGVRKETSDEWVKRFGLQKIWHGQIISEPVTITIVE
jgi:hypothetical protein